MLKLLFFILFTVFTLSAYPAAVEKDTVAKSSALINDSSKVTVRNFDQEKIKTYSRQAEFKYDSDVPTDDWWNKFWRWFWRLFKGAAKHGPSSAFIRYIIIVVLAVLIVYVLVKTAGVDLRILLGKPKRTQIGFTESQDNIHEIDFNEQIQQAINNGNYRLAVRLCYLSALKKLSDQSLITWQPEKTNHAYIKEIEDHGIKNQFQLLTRQFEYIWYGDFHIDKDSFVSIKSNFDQFKPGKQ